MTDTAKKTTLQTRVISAVIALVILIGLYVTMKVQGLRCICIFGGLMAILEFARLTFQRFDASKRLEWNFVGLATIVFLITSGGLLKPTYWGSLEIALIVAAMAAIALTMLALLTIRVAEDLSPVLETQAFSLMGLFYCGVFPGLTARLLFFENGQIWFLGLLAIVFSGDTGAYFAGRAFGKRKLLEPVSPQKTIEGSLGGLLGSSLAGFALTWFLPQYPPAELVLIAAVTGAFAQIGDLFESLLKRVAEVKDSGRLMPGHGGVLDRLDGVLIGAPVYYALISYLVG